MQQQPAPSSGGELPADEEDEDPSSTYGDLHRMETGRGIVVPEEQQWPRGRRSTTRASLQAPSSLTVEEDVKPAMWWSSSSLVWVRYGFRQQ